MAEMLRPVTVDELAEAVRSTPRVLAVGARTKPRLSAVPGVTLLSMTGLRGIIEYDPTEFTFTALAGTPMREIAAALAEKGQYLPFDPMLADSGATLGGTVAAGLNGPGRFRYGGVRDFILGVRFVDGSGRLLRLGGKVVKNAAGFDLPKFFTGSLGRFGVLAEITFKVFPRPASSLTLHFPAGDITDVTGILTAAAGSRWELEALDANLDERAVLARLAGPAAAIDTLAGEILGRWPGRKLLPDEADQIWRQAAVFGWAHPGGVLIKVALTPAQLPLLSALGPTLADVRLRATNGGNAAFLSLPSPVDAPRLGEGLRTLGIAALTLWGDAPLWPAGRDKPAIASAVKGALDPQNRFPTLDY